MGRLPEWWTGPYPEVSSLKSATDYLDGLGANLSRKEEEGAWVLSTGSQELITTDTADELDSFVLGFALAHLICERHGLIGERSGPQPVPHPRDAETQEGAGEADGGETAESEAEDPGGSEAEDRAGSEAEDRGGSEDRGDSEDEAGGQTEASADDGGAEDQRD